MFDEAGLRRGGAALHPVDHDHVRAGMHRQLHVVEGARRADLDVDGLFPVGHFPQFLNLDGEIVRPRPVGMAAGGTLVDPGGQGAHSGDAGGDFLSQ